MVVGGNVPDETRKNRKLTLYWLETLKRKRGFCTLPCAILREREETPWNHMWPKPSRP